MSCDGQAADGTQILRPETVNLIRTPQKPSFGNDFTYCMAGYDYGLGVRTRIDCSAGQRSRVGEFGWDGAAGAYVLMDPDKQVAIAYLQHLHDGIPFFGSFHPPLRDLTYEALGL